MRNKSQAAREAAYERVKEWRRRNPYRHKKQWERSNERRRVREAYKKGLQICKKGVEKPGIEVEGF
jgi:hypothetical protein